MDRQRQAQEQQHPLPLWLRWSLAIFVPLVVVGGAILWIIQGNGAIIPIAVFTALGTLLAFSQVLPLLFPRAAHRRQETTASASSLLPPMDQETPLHTAFEATAFLPSRSASLAPHDDASQMGQEEHPAASSRLSKAASLWKVPTPLTPLIGREQDVVRIATLLKQPAIRCLTLIGPGGIGKTRLALQVAIHLRDYFADGICFVALAAITDPELVIPAIARELGIQGMVGLTLVEQVTLSLRDRNFLLILDNFEQVAGAAPKVEEQLQACPSLKILVTSRAVLHVQGEQEFPVSPLALPPRSQLPEYEDLAQYEAIALFVQRAQAILPHFRITQANARTVAEICVRLDGLPLAIELAAARMRIWSPQALLSQLTQRFEVLTSKTLSVPERQQTLRNTLNWSYNLLDTQEQRLFRGLSVFVGGCTLEAVEAMGKASQIAEPHALSALDGVASLLEKSLLQVEQEGEPRFIMLETIREFGLACLRENEEIEASQRAHALYYLAEAEEAERHLKGAQQVEWLHRLDREQKNLRAALEWLIDQEETEFALQLSGALWRFWDIRGYWSEGRRWLVAALELSQPGERTVARAKVLCGAGSFALSTGDAKAARSLLKESVALYRELGDKQGLAESLVGLGWSRYSHNGDAATRKLLEESVALAREVGGGWILAYSLENLAECIRTQGSTERAHFLLEESVAFYREQGDIHRLSRTLNAMARTGLFQDNVTQATALAQESLTLARMLDNKLDIARALLRLAQTKSAQSDEAQAMSLLEESLALARELGTKLNIADALLTLGSLVLYQGDLIRAAIYAQESLTLYREVGAQGNLDVALCLLGEVRRSQGDFLQAKALHHDGLSLAREGAGHPYGIGWNLIGLAKVAVAEGQAQRAALLFGAAGSWLDLSMDMDPIERVDYERTVEGVRAQLGEEAFKAAWVQGRSMTPEQVLVSLEQAPTRESER